MKLEVTDQELAVLELELASACGPGRVHALVGLAWHLRQRDSLRAQDLISQAERGLAACRLPADDARALTARLALAACEIAAMFCRLDEGEAWLRRARAHLVPAVDPHAEGDAWLAEAWLAKATAERDREVQAHEQAMAFFADSDDRQRAGVARGRALCERIVSEGDAAALGCDTRAELWPDGGPASECMRLALEGFAQQLREPARAAQLYAQAGRLAQDMGMLRAACILMVNAGNSWLELGDLDRAASYLDEAASQACRSGWPTLIGICKTHVGGVLRRLGRHQDSQCVLNAALAQLRTTPPGIKTAMACSELALTLTELGQELEAIEVMEEALGFFREFKSYGNLAVHLVKQVRALAGIRDAGRALAAAEEARVLIERHGYTALAPDLRSALSLVHRRCKLAPPPDMTAPTAAIYFAQTALSCGMSVPGWKPPPALLNSIAEAWAEADYMTQAYFYSRQAHLAQQQDEEFKTMNPQAMLRLLGYGASSAPQSLLPRERTVRPRPVSDGAIAGPRPASGEVLTVKETEILQLLARNYANKEIAQMLGVSAETIKWHLKGLYGKLEVGTRRQAVLRARTLGMLGRSTEVDPLGV